MPSNNNRFREYTIYFPSDVADLIKRQAHEQGITEAELIKRCVAEKLFAAPALPAVHAGPPIAELPVAA